MASTALKQSTEDFLRELQVAEATLERVARKLEEEFAQRFQQVGIDPLALVKRINKLSTELPELRSECQALIQRKQDLIDSAKQQLVSNRSKLHVLCSKSGMMPQDDTQTYQAFSQACSEWDQQVAVQNAEFLEQPAYLSRDELNMALASSMLAR